MRTLHAIKKESWTSFCGLYYRNLVDDPYAGIIHFENICYLSTLLEQIDFELCDSCFNLPEIQIETLAHIEL